MESIALCPVCHKEVKPADYFCPNCGKNLKPAPPSASNASQIEVYLKSFFLPPYGILIGLRFLGQKDSKSKTVGIISIALTIISLLIAIKITLDLVGTINTQMNSQLKDMNF